MCFKAQQELKFLCCGCTIYILNYLTMQPVVQGLNSSDCLPQECTDYLNFHCKQFIFVFNFMFMKKVFSIWLECFWLWKTLIITQYLQIFDVRRCSSCSKRKYHHSSLILLLSWFLYIFNPWLQHDVLGLWKKKSHWQNERYSGIRDLLCEDIK